MVKKEKGAITLFTVVICMFLLVNVLLINVGVMNRNASQEKEIAKISENYEVSQAKMEQAYQEVIDSKEYPTYGELLKLLDDKIQEEKLKEYPVGSVYISTKETDPSKFIGGTWERYGKGKTLVGLDENQAEFDTVDETGGQKNITLSEAQLPSHSHSIPELSGSTSAAGKHTHTYSKSATATEGVALTINQILSHTHTYDKSATSTAGVAITADQMPSHTHTISPKITVTSTFSGRSSTTSTDGNHSHLFNRGEGVLSWPVAPDGKQHEGYTTGGWGSSTTTIWEEGAWIVGAGAHNHTVIPAGDISNTVSIENTTTSATGGLNGTTQAHSHSITLTSTNTGAAGGLSGTTQAHAHSISLSNANTSEVADHTHTVTTDANTTEAAGSGQAVNVQDPYITVYMWRRIS